MPANRWWRSLICHAKPAVVSAKGMFGASMLEKFCRQLVSMSSSVVSTLMDPSSTESLFVSGNCAPSFSRFTDFSFLKSVCTSPVYSKPNVGRGFCTSVSCAIVQLLLPMSATKVSIPILNILLFCICAAKIRLFFIFITYFCVYMAFFDIYLLIFTWIL